MSRQKHKYEARKYQSTACKSLYSFKPLCKLIQQLFIQSYRSSVVLAHKYHLSKLEAEIVIFVCFVYLNEFFFITFQPMLAEDMCSVPETSETQQGRYIEQKNEDDKKTNL